MINPLHFALLVGIDRYPGLVGGDLDSPSRNIGAFRRWLCRESGGGLLSENVQSVPASTPDADRGDPVLAQPNQAAIDDALETLHHRARAAVGGSGRRWEQTRLYVFWSGHGILPTRTGPDDRPMAALRTADTRAATPGAHVDLSSYLGYLVRRAGFREVVAFADCCRDLTDVAPRGPSLSAPDGPERTVVTLAGYAADAGDPAFARRHDSDRYHARGIFTAALIEVLEEWGSLRADDVGASALTLFNDQMPVRMAGQLGTSRQVPVFHSNGVADLDFGPGGGPAVHTVRLQLPPGAREVVLADGRLKPLADWAETAGPVDVRLRRGLYRVTVGGSGDGLRNQGLFEVAGGDCVVAL